MLRLQILSNDMKKNECIITTNQSFNGLGITFGFKTHKTPVTSMIAGV